MLYGQRDVIGWKTSGDLARKFILTVVYLTVICTYYIVLKIKNLR
jgi:hypothetical protein